MYTPSQTLLDKYARVIIDFALNSGEGIKPGETVFLAVPEIARPFVEPLYRAVIRSGGNPLISLEPSYLGKILLEEGNDHQREYMPHHMLLGRIADIDHSVRILAEYDKYEFKDVDPKKLTQRMKAGKFYKDALFKKEGEGKLTWNLCLYGTKPMADEVGMSEEQYWDQIAKACYLYDEDPIATWKNVFRDIESYRQKLNALPIEWIHVQGEGIDLHVQIGADRQWLGGSGRNIPSFELFTSPNWRGTHGKIHFNEPLYRYGNKIDGISLEFENGVITRAHATVGNEILQSMITTPNANKLGEFSLTDKRHSKIDKVMGETLFDENFGGQWGNTHIAIGSAYKDAYKHSPEGISVEKWDELGFNDSAEHTDIISTTQRTVTATLTDGSKKIIYKDGEFTL